MLKGNWKTYVLWVLLVEAVGVLAALLTRDGTEWFVENAVKPPLTPPSIVFPIVWTVLYGLMGISSARIWQSPDSPQRLRSLNLFIIQLILNFFWTLIFFNARAYGVASIWIVILWVTVLLMILQFRKVDMLAAWLQIPYLIWMTLASYLTFGVWLLNG